MDFLFLYFSIICFLASFILKIGTGKKIFSKHSKKHLLSLRKHLFYIGIIGAILLLFVLEEVFTSNLPFLLWGYIILGVLFIVYKIFKMYKDLKRIKKIQERKDSK